MPVVIVEEGSNLSRSKSFISPVIRFGIYNPNKRLSIIQIGNDYGGWNDIIREPITIKAKTDVLFTCYILTDGRL